MNNQTNSINQLNNGDPWIVSNGSTRATWQLLEYYDQISKPTPSLLSSPVDAQQNNPTTGQRPTTSAPKNVSLRASRKRAQAAPIVKSSPKKRRGRPKKVTTAVSQNQVVAQFPAAATTSTATATTSSIGILFSSTPASSGILPAPIPSSIPSEYVPPMTSRPAITATTPVPPNWLANIEDTVVSLSTFNLYDIPADTAEYQTISDMMYPIGVKKIKQIVNPDLWDRFVKTRTDMIRSKTDDLNVLTKLGLSEKEVMRCAHLSMNFRKDPLLIPYSDNMVLLFHCTRNKSNVDSILSQGLDERLSYPMGGRLGRGIYFADDPNKSLQYDGTGYIFIFAVLLGDCISVDHFTNQQEFVREPEKVAQEKRNSNDQFFDSIVARPADYNEYVIYNRYQCCPIYQIEYRRNTVGGGSVGGGSIYESSSQQIPPFAWIPAGQNYTMPIQDQTMNWPFLAVDLFTSMGVAPPTDEDINNNAAQESQAHQASIDDNMTTLMNLGFNDETQNREILAKFNNDLDRAVDYYLGNQIVEQGDTEPPPADDMSASTASATSNTRMLIQLGFVDEAKNREVLAQFNNDIDQAIDYLLGNIDGTEGDNTVSGADSDAAAASTNQSTIDQCGDCSENECRSEEFFSSDEVSIIIIEDDSDSN